MTSLRQVHKTAKFLIKYVLFKYIKNLFQEQFHILISILIYLNPLEKKIKLNMFERVYPEILFLNL